MAEKVKPIPDGFHTVTPHLVVRDAKKALEFYQRAFGAEVLGVSPTPDGKVMHAAIRIGDSLVMLNDEFPDWKVLSPLSLNGTPVTIHLAVQDVDASYDRAVKAGATAAMPVQNQFWGDRYGQVVDPFGHRWSIATRVENLSPDEIEKRAKEFFSKDHAK
ncbi:MAG: glyoxalase [Acidobacteria bacterium]|nr:MAG: glyoxalase [Acidobacteriota bacterium]